LGGAKGKGQKPGTKGEKAEGEGLKKGKILLLR
jgi:hypothetical protein